MPDQLTVDREALAQALRDCLAWGRAYDASKTEHQWDEMRDRQVAQQLEALQEKR